jgi:hypothetical protein
MARNEQLQPARPKAALLLDKGYVHAVPVNSNTITTKSSSHPALPGSTTTTERRKRGIDCSRRKVGTMQFQANYLELSIGTGAILYIAVHVVGLETFFAALAFCAFLFSFNNLF